MPTCGRLIHDNAVCHIIQRGNNRQKICVDEEDFGKFLSLIDTYKAKFAFELYHYCLMANHLHLLLKIIMKDDLAKLMQGIFQSYRFYFKRKYRYSGYLYQGRYKSKLIKTDNYLLDCARYIERNPLRARIINDLSQYRWTSYPVYALGHESGIITENPLFSTLSNDGIKRRQMYRDYVIPARPYEEILDREFGIAHFYE